MKLIWVKKNYQNITKLVAIENDSTTKQKKILSELCTRTLQGICTHNFTAARISHTQEKPLCH